jgi:2',3'-cyclic-nucleotide 2'-phosphodiesterase (5'-nucleotidase family)
VKARLGGLARRATLVTKLRAEGVPALHFDAGDAFQARYEVTAAERTKVLDMADVFIRAFNSTKLDGYAVGDRDLALGIPELKKLEKRSKFPWLCANLVDAKSKKPLFKASVMLEAAGKKVLVVAAVTKTFFKKKELLDPQGIELADPAELVRAEIQKHPGADLVVLLGHLNAGEIKEVVEKSPEIHFVLGGQTYRHEQTLGKVGGALVANGYFKGKNISVVDVGRIEKGKPFVDRNAKKGLVARKATLERQLKSREMSLERARKNPARKGSLDYLERNLVQLKTELQEVSMNLEDAAEPDKTAPWVRWDLTAMGKTIPDEPKVGEMVAAYRKKYPEPKKAKRQPPRPSLRKGPGTRPAPTRLGPRTRQAVPPSRRPTAPTH